MSGASRNIHLIKTEAGNNMLPPCRRVLVRFGDHYVPKEARDLVPGDRVRWKKEYIQKTLDEVDSVLSCCSSRYNWARQVVMEQNSAHVWIPKLRILLLEAAACATKAQIMLEGEGIPPEMAARVADQALYAVEEYGKAHGIKPVCWDTVSNWVMGRVIAPAEKRFLDALSGINPKFQPIFQDFQSNGPWAEAYKIYVSLRQVAMSYISGISGEPSAGGAHAPKSPGRDFSPELSAIVDSFGIDVRTGTMDAEVISAESIRMRAKSLSGKKKADPDLFRGLVTFEDGLAAGLEVDNLLLYSNDEIFGMPHAEVLANPEKAVENSKNFAIAHGFSLADMGRRLIRSNLPKDEIGDIAREFFAKSHAGSPEELRAHLLRNTGLTYEQLPPEGRAQIDALVDEILTNLVATVKSALGKYESLTDAIHNGFEEDP